MNILDSIQKDYAIINKTAGEFLSKLSGNDIHRDILLASEIGGLELLRASGVDFSKYRPGSILLGAIPDEIFEQMQRFVFGWAISNGIDPKGIGKGKIPDKYKDYQPEITQFEISFLNLCQQNSIKGEYYPFVALASALKLVLAGEKLKLLDAKTGLAMVLYHIIVGSKTVPYQPSLEKS
jgi:hypothetical protein